MMLAEIYQAQRRLNERTVGFDVLSITDEAKRLEWFRNYLTAWDQELKELIESLDLDAVVRGRLTDGFMLDVRNVRVEVVDMLHFLMSMFQVIGEPEIRESFLPGIPGDFPGFLASLRDDHERRCGMPIPWDSDQEVMNRLLTLHGLHAVVETGRILDRVQWKWWARQVSRWDEVRLDLYRVLFPRWCFLVLSTGMDDAGVVDLYMRKNKLNFERQDGGYKDGSYRKKDEEGREDNEKLFERK